MEFSKFLDGKVPITVSGDLSSALDSARKLAKKEKAAMEPGGAVVLLSPASASFDQFENFEARGDAFREMVEALPGKHLDPFEEPGIFPGTRGSEETAP